MSMTEVFYSSDYNFSQMTDEDLIELIKSDNNKHALEHLINRYKDLVNIKVSKYYIIGAEREDIIQEGLIGLYKAIKSYQSDKQNSFKSFASICIERQLITELEGILDANIIEDPLDMITKKEYYQLVESTIDKSLSSFEKKVLNCYIQGESYGEIAQRLETPVKSIDNAIQRIRKKAIKGMQSE